MSFDFNGNTVATRYDSNFTGIPSNGLSMSFWWQGDGALFNPYVIAKQNPGYVFAVYFADASIVGLGIEGDFSGGYAEYLFPLPSLSNLVHVALKFDTTDGSVVPSVWYDGVAQTATSSIPQSGTLNTNAAPLRLCGATFGAGQTMDGEIQDLVVWDDLIPDAMLQNISKGLSANHLRRETQLFNVNFREPVQDRSPNAHTLTLVGTAPTQQPNFPGVPTARRR